MNKAQFIRHLETLSPRSDYAGMLHKEFGLEVPAGAPKYQQEYLYKYLMQSRVNGVPEADLLAKAKAEVDAFVQQFPWVTKKYDEVSTVKTVRTKKEKRSYPDGTIVFVKEINKFEGFLFGRCVSRCSKVEQVKAFMTKRYGTTDFIEKQ